MAKAWIILGIWLAGNAYGTSTRAPCDPPPPENARWEIGVALQFLNPTNLPNFRASLPAYGPSVSYRLWGHPLKLQALYGADNALSLQLIELGYQYRLRTPYISGFLEGGGHFLRYSVSGVRQTFVGAFAGAGLLFDLARNFAIDITVKAYHQGKPILSFGGGFHVSL